MRAAGSGRAWAERARAETSSSRTSRPRTCTLARSKGKTKSAAGARTYWIGEVMEGGIWGTKGKIQIDGDLLSRMETNSDFNIRMKAKTSRISGCAPTQVP